MAAYSPLEAETNTLRAALADLPLTQSMGRDGPVSEHGLAYQMIIKGEGSVKYFIGWAEQYFLTQKDKGSTGIVWRVKPEVMNYEDRRHHAQRLVLQFHLLPKPNP